MAQRGGHKRQRLEATGACFAAPKDGQLTTGLAILLLRKWSMGEISAPTLQEIAKAAVEAGIEKADVCQLARLGGSGSSPQNIQRDLQVLHFKNLVSPEPFMLKTKIKHKDSNGEWVHKTHPLPVLLPHEWLHSIDKRASCPNCFLFLMFCCFSVLFPCFVQLQSSSM